jgi:hypothetical protein
MNYPRQEKAFAIMAARRGWLSVMPGLCIGACVLFLISAVVAALVFRAYQGCVAGLPPLILLFPFPDTRPGRVKS